MKQAQENLHLLIAPVVECSLGQKSLFLKMNDWTYLLLNNNKSNIQELFAHTIVIILIFLYMHSF